MNKLFLVSPTIEGITLGAAEEVDEVAGGANDMDVDRIGEVGQAAGVYVNSMVSCNSRS